MLSIDQRLNFFLVHFFEFLKISNSVNNMYIFLGNILRIIFRIKPRFAAKLYVSRIQGSFKLCLTKIERLNIRNGIFNVRKGKSDTITADINR